MAIENNIIKSPVHLAANVARLLQTNKMTTAALCTHPNINMWAKYRPVRHRTPAHLTEEQRTEALQNAFDIPYFASVQAFRDAFRTGETDWRALLPGENDHKRLGDFLGYYANGEPDPTKGYQHDIDKQIWGLNARYDGVWYIQYSHLGVVVMRNAETMYEGAEIMARIETDTAIESQRAIQIDSLIEKLQNCYFGIALISTDASVDRVYVRMASVVIGSAEVAGNERLARGIVPSLGDNSEWYVVPFICTQKLDDENAWGVFGGVAPTNPQQGNIFIAGTTLPYIMRMQYKKSGVDYGKITITDATDSASYINFSISIPLVSGMTIEKYYIVVQHSDIYSRDAYENDNLESAMSAWLNVNSDSMSTFLNGQTSVYTKPTYGNSGLMNGYDNVAYTVSYEDSSQLSVSPDAAKAVITAKLNRLSLYNENLNRISKTTKVVHLLAEYKLSGKLYRIRKTFE